MNKADIIFKRNIKEILENGVMSGDARPVYSNGRKAHSKYITQVYRKIPEKTRYFNAEMNQI